MSRSPLPPSPPYGRATAPVDIPVSRRRSSTFGPSPLSFVQNTSEQLPPPRQSTMRQQQQSDLSSLSSVQNTSEQSLLPAQNPVRQGHPRNPSPLSSVQNTSDHPPPPPHPPRLPRLDEAAQNRHNRRVRKYYGNQELVPDGSAVPRPDVARRERRSGIRNAVVTPSRRELMGEGSPWWEVEGWEDVGRIVALQRPVSGASAARSPASRPATRSQPPTNTSPNPDEDHHWTADELVNESDIPDLPLGEEDPGKDFEKIGDEENEAGDFQVIEPSADNGVAPNASSGVGRKGFEYLRC